MFGCRCASVAEHAPFAGFGGAAHSRIVTGVEVVAPGAATLTAEVDAAVVSGFGFATKPARQR